MAMKTVCSYSGEKKVPLTHAQKTAKRKWVSAQSDICDRCGFTRKDHEPFGTVPEYQVSINGGDIWINCSSFVEPKKEG